MKIATCSDCIHVDVCEQNPSLICFSRDNAAYCQGFKDKQQYVPVKWGKWIRVGQDIYCSNCQNESGYTWHGSSSFSYYCPHCGADMREEKENGK